jgi:pimeloyl-ACP methyl ester carboxylesterase
VQVCARRAGEYEVLTVDLPGHGQSPALRTRPTVSALTDAVAADLDVLGHPRVHLLGTRWARVSRWSWPGAGVPFRWWRSRDASQAEARAVRPGFADARDFWATLWLGVLTDVPIGLGQIDCLVVLAQGTADWISGGQTPRFLLAVPGSRFRPLFGAGHAPQSDVPDTIVRLVHEATGRRTEH